MILRQQIAITGFPLVLQRFLSGNPKLHGY
jgi:hypothetical protein